MTGEQPQSAPRSNRSLSAGTIAGLVGIVVVVLFAAWWFLMRDEDAATPTPSPSPSATSSPTPSPSLTPSPTPSSTIAEPALTDVNGRWCPTSPEEWEDVCVTIDLPSVVSDGYEDSPSYVYPWDAPDVHPSEFDYDFVANLGQCWNAAVDVYPGTSGAAFYYCPAGALSGEEWIDTGDFVNEDRVYMTQEETPYPYLRAD